MRASPAAGADPRRPAARALRGDSHWTSTRELRKLHIWRRPATQEEMARALRAAGMPQNILDLIPTLVDAWRGRRKWLPPARQTIHAFRLSTLFNLRVECDI
eukprot:6237983-Pyramimonas_sp.AAC.1